MNKYFVWQKSNINPKMRENAEKAGNKIYFYIRIYLYIFIL